MCIGVGQSLLVASVLDAVLVWGLLSSGVSEVSWSSFADELEVCDSVSVVLTFGLEEAAMARMVLPP